MSSAGIFETQKSAPSWGLGRISHRRTGVQDYVYHRSAGKGVSVYVVDTGIDIQHPEFEGRAQWGHSFIDEPDTDLHGHGTHVAGTIGSKSFGVAKKVNLIAVKALGQDSRGPDSGIIAAMDWVVNHAREKGVLGKAIMNLSLGGDTATALNEAAEKAVKAGMFLGVAAGNANVSELRLWSFCSPFFSTISFINGGIKLTVILNSKMLSMLPQRLWNPYARSLQAR